MTASRDVEPVMRPCLATHRSLRNIDLRPTFAPLMSKATPSLGEQWKLKDTMSPSDVRPGNGFALRAVDFDDLRGDIVLVAGPCKDRWYPAIALSLGGVEVVIERHAFDAIL